MSGIRRARSVAFRRRNSMRIECEALEQRLPLAAFLVTSGADDGPGTLRNAIAMANATSEADEIAFASEVNRVTLTSGQLNLSADVTIGGSADVEIVRSATSGTPRFRIFEVSPGVSATLDRLTLVNGAENQGGAILNNGSLTLRSSILRNNASRIDGGGVYNQNGRLNVIDTAFLSNTAGNSGGAIADYGTLGVETSLFSGNVAGNQGGAIFEAGTSTLAFATLTGNSAHWGGAVYVRNQGQVSIDSSTLDANSARFGGAIGNLGTVRATQSTLSGNSAIQMGGAVRNQGELSINFSTIAGNAAFVGGGIDNRSRATLIGSIVADSPSGGDLNGNYSGSFNLVEDGSGSGLTGTIVADPMLGPLAHNGGPTKTHALLLGSPAINTGSNALAIDAQGNPVANDQRGTGFPRILGGTVDYGAVEFGEPPSLVVTTADDVVNPTDGLTSLREAVAYGNTLAGSNTVTFIAGLTGVWLTSGEVVITANLSVSGGTSSVTIARDTAANLPAFRLFRIDAGAVSRFDRLTLTGGSADQTSSVVASAGGAVLNDGTLVIDSCTITSNQASQHGAGVLTRGNLSVISSTISGNMAQYMGGGVFVWSDAITTIAGSHISGNVAVEGGGVSNYGKTSIVDTEVNANTARGWFGGGGLRNGGSGIYEILGCLIQNNVSLGQGGGLTNFGISTIDGTRFSGNSASGKGGGAIANGNSTLILSNLVFENNSTNVNGGAIYSEGKITGTGLTFLENVASGAGGAVYTTNAGLFSTFRNASFVGNRAADGGALWNIAIVQLTETSFTNNLTTTGSGGAIANWGTASLADSNLTGNTAKDAGGAIFNFNGGTFAVSNSRIVSNKSLGFGGGGIYNRGNLTVSNGTRLELNTASNGGGGFMNFSTGQATFTDATFVNNTAAVSGGGIFSYTSGSGMLSVVGGAFTGNQATYGGGIFVYTGNGSISGALISGNTASQNGGGLYVDRLATVNASGVRIVDNRGSFAAGVQNTGIFTLTNSTLDGNRTSGWVGGGILNSGTLTVSGSTLTNNAAPNSGGGAIANFGTATVTVSDLSRNTGRDVGAVYNPGTMTISGSTLTGNVVSGWAGGALFNEGNLTVRSSTVRDNRANEGGGLYNTNAGRSTIESSSFIANTSAGNGGAIANFGTLSSTNSTYGENRAVWSGGAIFNAGSATILNNTIAFNSAANGGGIFNQSPGTVNLRNSIVANSLSGGDLRGTFSGSKNLVRDGSGTGLTGTIIADPMLGTLADNGGPTLTYNLTSVSPAINAGSNALAVDSQGNPLANDQRGAGFARILGSTVDIGAVEFVEVPSLIVTTADDVVNPTDGWTSLRESVNYANSKPGADVISFRAGLSQVILSTDQLIIRSEVTITGGDSRVTISRSTASGTPAFRLIWVLPGAKGNFDRLTLRGGSSDYGAGIASGGNSTVVDCVFTDNIVTIQGGGLSNYGTMTVSNCLFERNTADQGGGLINAGIMTLQDSIFRNNVGNWGGGAIRAAAGGRLNILRTQIYDNSAYGVGGGIMSYGAVSVVDSTIRQNTVTSWAGGAIFSGGGTMDVTGCTLTGNTAKDGGGIWSQGRLTVRSSEISGNTAISGGGIMIPTNATATIESSSIRNNFANWGGGMLNYGTATIRNSGISENSANTWSGGGVFNTETGTLTVEDSEIVGNSGPSGGGLTNSGRATISRTVFRANRGSQWVGGGIWNMNSGILTVHDVDMDRNVGAVFAGAIHNEGQSTVRNSTFTENTAPGWAGGAIYNHTTGNFTIENSTFSGNSASGAGGAVYNVGTMSLAGSTLTGNVVPGWAGGAIYNEGNLAVRSSTIQNNRAAEGGAFFNANSGQLTVESSSFIGNSASVNGGAIANRGTLNSTNSTFGENRADYAGGAIENSGSVIILNNTIAFNSASIGGGIYNETSGTVSLKNSIVANNLSGGDLRGTFSGSKNLVRDGSGSGLTFTIVADPMLGVLQNNGGPTWTYALLAGSAAIDAGDNAFIPLTLTTDQRGTGRPRIRGIAVDLGAYES